MDHNNLTQGGMVGGQPVDSVTFLLFHLAALFAPFGEESRLQSLTELMQFQRNQGESIDAMLSRFLTLRHRAATGGTGMAMNWEGYSWLLLKACRVNHHQLLRLLQPFQGRFPNNEHEFNSMQMPLRRMGHILENSVGNIARQLRTLPGHFFQNSQPAQQQDP